MKSPRILTYSAEGFLDLIFPKICHGCRLEGTYLCLLCQVKVKPPLERCFVCREPVIGSRTHAECLTRKLTLDGLVVAAEYENRAVRDLIWNLKYNYVAEIASVLSVLLVDYFLGSDLVDYFKDAAVVPVPLHKRRKLARGFNQSELLAQNFAGRLNLQFLRPLTRHKNSKRQVDLEKTERFENVKNSIIAEPTREIQGRKIILVDDVATTGATLNECAKALKTAGAAEVWGLVVARN